MSALKKNIEIYPKQYDLLNCDDEPLRFIRRLQSYSSLIVADRELQNWHFATEDLLSILDSEGLNGIAEGHKFESLKDLPDGDSIDVETAIGFRRVSKQWMNGKYYLEFEKIDEGEWNIEKYQEAILRLGLGGSLDEFLDLVIEEVNAITGFSHIMIYQFDEAYNGKVIKEMKTDHHPSYLGMKFPATDIPKQARALYFTEKIRVIADTQAEQVGIYKNPKSKEGDQLELAHIYSRGVSPIHLEYLSNMGVNASFSVALMKDDDLWGLIACHHHEPKIIDLRTRNWLMFLSRFISSNLDNLIKTQIDSERIQSQLKTKELTTKLLDSRDLLGSIFSGAGDIKKIMSCQGLILKSGNEIRSSNTNLDSDKINALFQWLKKKGAFDLYATSHSKSDLPESIYDRDLSGLLIVQLSPISQDYIIFTRPERSEEVVWAGNPNETKQFVEEKGRLTPRKSFEKWKGIYKDHAKPWSDFEQEFALELKSAIKSFVYEKFDELKRLNKELKQAYEDMESFSYMVSHDLKAPLRAISGFANVIEEDYADKLDDYGLKALDMIKKSISKMNKFIEEILNFSKISNNKLAVDPIDVNSMILEVWSTFGLEGERAELILVEGIPTVYGDRRLVKQVFSNLISNSLKYAHDDREPVIQISFREEEGFIVISIQDNGIGIPEGKELQIFEIFRRVVHDRKYEGTGIGLAIVKKVIDRHGGDIFVEKINEPGSKLTFLLPKNKDRVLYLQKKKSQSQIDRAED